MPASMASAMKSTTIAVKRAASMKSTITSVEAAAAVESTVTAEAFMLKPAMAAKTAVYENSLVKARATVEASAIEAGPAIKSRSVVAMEPWARSDEYPSGEPVGAIIAVGSAGVWIIAIVAISADRSRAYIRRANSDTDNHSLCLGKRCRT